MADKYTGQQIEVLPESHGRQETSLGRYLATRFSSLKPPMNKAPNPIRLLALLNARQWAFFFIGFVAWVRIYIYIRRATKRCGND
jgi:MFS transporter, SHS family, lactate transporter